MLTHCQNSLGYRAGGLVLAAVAGAAWALSAGPACAQGFFESFFQRTTPSAPAYSNPNTDLNPYGARPEPQRQETGGAAVYCVRTCDGRYFPIQRTAGSNPAQLCSSFCPAGETKIYSGGSIDHATATDGKRYSELSTAFIYREKIVPGCTCNGSDAFGLVPLHADEDASLRAGDIVATNNGLMAYSGVGRGRSAQFTPIDAQRGLSAELRQKLSETKVDPAVATPTPVHATAGGQRDGASTVRNGRNKRVQVGR